MKAITKWPDELLEPSAKHLGWQYLPMQRLLPKLIWSAGHLHRVEVYQLFELMRDRTKTFVSLVARCFTCKKWYISQK